MSNDTREDRELADESMTDQAALAAAISSTYKVLGELSDGGGAGVLGKNTASTGTPIGVEGAVANSSVGFGLATPDDVRIEGVLDSNGTDFTVTAGATSDARNVVLGHASNTAPDGTVGGTIGGGGFDDGTSVWPNKVKNDYATVGGGRNNTAGGKHATVAGGESNDALGKGGTVSGGTSNVVTATLAVIGGGQRNTAFGDGATVAGGGDNTATSGIAGTISGGTSNAVTAWWGTVSGGDRNTASETGATVGGGFVNTASEAGSTVGGGDSNTAGGAKATVGGGVDNTAKSGFDYATISGGTSNVVKGVGATIGGGSENTASGQEATVGGGDGNTTDANSATIGGGIGNTASSRGATVGGGSFNTATSGANATVGGGYDNTGTGDVATVGGGSKNTASGSYATVGGGENNTASDRQATVGGGTDNLASENAATVGGGFDNNAHGPDSTIGGGINNRIGKSGTAKGAYATVPGGRENVAREDHSFAAGDKAKARDEGAFVWADSVFASFASDQTGTGSSPTGTDTFHVRATGGVRLVTGLDSNDDPSAGAYLSTGGSSWQTVSARSAKHDVEPVDPQAVLAGVETLTVSTWAYDANPGVRRMGPMAGEFTEAFGLGDDPETIGHVDADGVALAAIQGLAQRLDEKDGRIDEQADRIGALEAENKQLRRENDALKERLVALEERVATIDGGQAPPAPADD